MATILSMCKQIEYLCTLNSEFSKIKTNIAVISWSEIKEYILLSALEKIKIQCVPVFFGQIEQMAYIISFSFLLFAECLDNECWISLYTLCILRFEEFVSKMNRIWILSIHFKAYYRILYPWFRNLIGANITVVRNRKLGDIM